MPPKIQQKSKEQKMAAAMAGGKGKKKKWSKGKSRDKTDNKVLFGKGKKKKWSKGKSRDKVDNKVLFGKDQHERFQNEVPKMKLITVSGVVEKLKISGGLAKRALRVMEQEGQIRE